MLGYYFLHSVDAIIRKRNSFAFRYLYILVILGSSLWFLDIIFGLSQFHNILWYIQEQRPFPSLAGCKWSNLAYIKHKKCIRYVSIQYNPLPLAALLHHENMDLIKQNGYFRLIGQILVLFAPPPFRFKLIILSIIL